MPSSKNISASSVNEKFSSDATGPDAESSRHLSSDGEMRGEIANHAGKNENSDIGAIRAYLLDLQKRLCAGLEDLENTHAQITPAPAPRHFANEHWQRLDKDGGGGITRVLEGGAVFERAGVAFSHVRGDVLPPSATARRPALAGESWEALGVSVVVHPRNPHVPVAHANVRFFRAGQQAWWFGGGFDLTPCYGYEEDARHWHRTAREALSPFDSGRGAETLYPRFKKNCDEYFFLKHRSEMRGVGGIFFDDFSEWSTEESFALMRSVGDAFLPAYAPIVQRRVGTTFTQREREFQLYRRGRYAEFNLVWDRGTHFGLQSGGRAESILISMPPLARWEYGYTPAPGSPEARLVSFFLKPRDWAS